MAFLGAGYIAGALILLNAFASFAFFRWAEAASRDQRHPETMGAAIVLWDGGVRLNTETRRRLAYGLELYRQGRVGKIVCVGGARPGRGAYGSSLTRDHLMLEGVPSDDILYEMKSHDTRTNIQEACELLGKAELVSAFLVTDSLQALRLRRLLDSENGPKRLFPAPYPATSLFGISDVIYTWYRIQKEWAASLAFHLVPTQLYRRILTWIRSH